MLLVKQIFDSTVDQDEIIKEKSIACENEDQEYFDSTIISEIQMSIANENERQDNLDLQINGNCCIYARITVNLFVEYLLRVEMVTIQCNNSLLSFVHLSKLAN